jgi:hypothetical protein
VTFAFVRITLVSALLLLAFFTTFPNVVGAQTVCNQTVQTSLADAPDVAVRPGDLVQRILYLTNPNPAECGTNTYLFSRSYPSGWLMEIPNSIEASGGATLSIPFSLKVASDSAAMLYQYRIWSYNSWADGSRTSQVNGFVEVEIAPSPTQTPSPFPTPTPDTTVPVVQISSPLNNSFIAKNSTVTIVANASDNVLVSKVEFYVNGVLRCSDLIAPYSCTFATSHRKGINYVLSAKAFDTASNSASSAIQVTTK